MLLLKNGQDLWLRGTHTGTVQVNAQGTAVNRLPGHVGHLQAGPGYKLRYGRQRIIKYVLMVDGVKLNLFQQIPYVRQLEHCRAFIVEAERNAGKKLIDAGNVRKDVISNDQISATKRLPDFFDRIRAEESVEGRYSFKLCHTRNVTGWLNSKHLNPTLFEELEQVPIVARDFENPRVRVEIESRRQLFGHVPRMRDEKLGI